jgi:uncharacterized membrane protein YccC
MKKRLLGALICYAVTVVLSRHFLPEYWGRISLAILAMDLGACYISNLMFKRRLEAAAALDQALEDTEGYETF